VSNFSGRQGEREGAIFSTSPLWGEVGRRPGEGARPLSALRHLSFDHTRKGQVFFPPLVKRGKRTAIARLGSRRWQQEHAFSHRRGVTLVEVIVVIAVFVLVLLFLLMMAPRAREQARMASCTNNLRQIGVALAIYDQLHQQLPAINALSGIDEPSGASSPGPLRTLLETLQLPDLTEMKDPKSRPQPRPGEVPDERPVPGFICSSDPNATAGRFAAPISYRGTTGESPAGHDGLFAIDRVLRLPDVEAADGSSYTAAFSERLVGDHEPGHPTPYNYQVVPGPLAGPECPVTGDASVWRGDAGSSWRWSDFRHTLYNHALPLSSNHSCLAVDGKTAFMGASSGHVRGVNLLLLDGSVTLVTREIDPKVWQEYARIGPPTRENR
jgi:prepilin-type N-terminal cleavage/methylation domain-containing protein